MLTPLTSMKLKAAECMYGQVCFSVRGHVTGGEHDNKRTEVESVEARESVLVKRVRQTDSARVLNHLWNRGCVWVVGTSIDGIHHRPKPAKLPSTYHVFEVQNLQPRYTEQLVC